MALDPFTEQCFSRAGSVANKISDYSATLAVVDALEGIAHEIAALREEIARTPEQRRLAAIFAPPAPVND